MTVQNFLFNAARQLSTMFPGYFSGAKHNHYRDFGYPEAITFDLLYAMYTRNSFANAAVDKTVLKTWQTMPALLEKERDGSEDGSTEETATEKDIRQKFDDLRLWQRMAETDRRGMVGGYSGLIMRLADGKRFNEPVDRVGGGLDGLVEVIPAWEGQLQVSEWDTDELSENYGQPKMYQFNESSVDNKVKQPRSFMLHPDRVIVWSRDGSVNGRSTLEPGYNDLLSLEKIVGAGGEGFWKNAKSGLVFEVDKEAQLAEIMAGLGATSASDVVDKMDERVEDFNKGFDQQLMVQGMTVKGVPVTLPSPQYFTETPLQAFAASMKIPTKILVGSQSGERASTEDANEWAQTNMSRREGQAIPTIMLFVNRLEQFGILPERDWYLEWADLTEATMAEKIERAGKMAVINKDMSQAGELIFTPDEIRRAADYEPNSDLEDFADDEGDLTDAMGGTNDLEQ